MSDDKDGGCNLAERIIKDLKTIFSRNEDILEFDIIPVDKQLYNKCPVIHVEQRVGLESWCVKHIFNYAYRKLIDHRTSVASCNPSDLNDLTFVLLLVNPDLAVAWNTRKELLQTKHINFQDELRLSEVILSRKPKSPDNFSHRQWVLRQVINSSPGQERLDDMARNELRVSLLTASKYQRNYYAWSHRLWVLANLCNFKVEMINYDLHLTRNWVENHVSDYSGFQYRQSLLQALGNVEQALDSELEMLNSLAQLYTDRESLFCHRRFVLWTLCKRFGGRTVALEEAESRFIENHSSHAYSNNTWQFQLIVRHIRWLNTVLKWELGSRIDPGKNAHLAKALTVFDSKFVVPNVVANSRPPLN